MAEKKNEKAAVQQPAASQTQVSVNPVTEAKEQPAKKAEKSAAPAGFSVKEAPITFSPGPGKTVPAGASSATKAEKTPAAGTSSSKGKETGKEQKTAAEAKKDLSAPADKENKPAGAAPADKADKSVPAAPADKADKPAAGEAKEENKFFSLFRKVHTPDDAVAFMPDAIEIKNERLPPWARYSVFFSLGFFLLALCWATFGKVDIVVKSTGKLISSKQNIVMKPLESAVISQIHVRIGDIVRKDQLLVTLDPSINQADADRLKNEIVVLQAEYDRLRAEFEGREYKPAEMTPAAMEQLSIFKQRADYFNAKLRYYDEAVKQLDASAKSKKDSLMNQESRLATVRKMEQMYEVLREKKTATLKELWNVQITRMEMEGNLDVLRNSLQELSHERESTLSARDGFIHEWKNSISESLVSTGRELDKNLKLYEQAQKMVSYVELRSPCQAVVHEIANFPEGSAVREGEAIITLIPLDGRIEVEAEVSPRDIGKVKINSEVRIKLSAYPFQKHGTLHGMVRNISEDTIQRSGSPAASAEGALRPGMTYYRALVAIDDMSGLRNLPENFRMIPGMEVEAEIKTGRRRIIEYLIYPLIKALDEAAREP